MSFKGIRVTSVEPNKTLQAREEKAKRIVTTGLCPDCGRKLRRNSSLPGWWQCEQYGASLFRADRDGPKCNFQVFLENEDGQGRPETK